MSPVAQQDAAVAYPLVRVVTLGLRFTYVSIQLLREEWAN